MKSLLQQQLESPADSVAVKRVGGAVVTSNTCTDSLSLCTSHADAGVRVRMRAAGEVAGEPAEGDGGPPAPGARRPRRQALAARGEARARQLQASGSCVTYAEPCLYAFSVHPTSL